MSTPVAGPLATTPLHVVAGDIAVWWNDPGATWESIPLGSGPAGPAGATGATGPAGPPGATGATGAAGAANMTGMVAGQIPIAATAISVASSTATLTASFMPAYTGDVTSSAGSTVNTLPTVNGNVGTWNNVTVNGKGQVTAGSNVAYVTGGPYLPLTGGTLTGNLTSTSITAQGIVAPGSSANIGIDDQAAPGIPNRWTWSASGGVATIAVSGVAALTLSSATGRVAAGTTAAGGYQVKAGASGAFHGNQFNIDWPGPAFWVDGVNVGNIAFTSDYRIKKDIAPLLSTWDRVKALKPISYTHQDFTPPVELERAKESGEPFMAGDDVVRWGFVAHELQETLVESAASAFKDAPDAIQSPNPFALLAAVTRALQEAMARIEALEASAC